MQFSDICTLWKVETISGINNVQGANCYHNNTGVSYNNMSLPQQQAHGGFVTNIPRMQHPAQSRNIISRYLSDLTVQITL